MSVWMFMKLFSDTCVIFAVLGSFPTLFVRSFSLLWPALLCGLAVGLASFLEECGKDRWRFLGAFLPLVSLFLPHSLGETVILLPPIVYTAVVIWRGDLTLEYYSFRQYFQRSLILLALLYILLCMIDFLANFVDPGEDPIDYGTTLFYGLLHTLTGVLLQRQLRLGEGQEEGKKMNQRQMLTLLVGTAAAVLCLIGAERLLHESGVTMALSLVTVLFSPFMMILDWLSNHVFRPVEQGYIEEMAEAISDSDVIMVPPRVEEVMGPPAPVEEAGSLWLLIVILVVVLAAMLFMLRTFRGRKVTNSSEEVVEKLRPAERAKKEAPRSNRSKIRRYYRRFLKEERKKGLKLRPHLTSEDILKETAAGEAATQLRQVYLSARYDEGREISPEQVELARCALKNHSGV